MLSSRRNRAMRNDYIQHWGLKKGDKKKNHLYVARVELANGKYRYFYSLAEYAAYLKAKAKMKLNNFNKNKEKMAADKINEGVDKLDKLYTDTLNKNKYLTDDYNYDKKIAQVKNTKEWQDIVKRKDPEYVYRNKNGETVYDVDAYLAKKKHPGLDVADDVVSGRRVTINQLDKEALVAGGVDYAKTYVTMAAIGTKFLLEKFKFSQGSYKDEKQQAINYYNENKERIASDVKIAQDIATGNDTQAYVAAGEKAINNIIKEYGNNPTYTNGVQQLKNASGVTQEDYEALQKQYEAYQKEYERLQEELEKQKQRV